MLELGYSCIFVDNIAPYNKIKSGANHEANTPLKKPILYNFLGVGFFLEIYQN